MTGARTPMDRMPGRIMNVAHARDAAELLFDLTFVAAFGVAGNALAHATPRPLAAGVGGFGFAMVAIVLGLDQLLVVRLGVRHGRLAVPGVTMVQMAGVIVLAIGLPKMFASLEPGEPGRRTR